MTIREGFENVIKHIKCRKNVDFSSLHTAMIYLLIIEEISYETYREMSVLCSTNFQVIAETSDRFIYVSYLEKVKPSAFYWKEYQGDYDDSDNEEELDGFLRMQLVEEILKIIHNDKKGVLEKHLKGDNSKETFERFLNCYGKIQIPKSIETNLEQFQKLAGCAHLCEDGTLYYISINRTFQWGGGDLRQCRLSTVSEQWNPEDGEILLKDIGRALYYSQVEDAIYMPYPYPVWDTFVRFDIEKKEYRTEYYSEIVGITKNGELLYIKKEKEIELRLRGKESDNVFGILQSDDIYRVVYPESVLILPGRRCRKIKEPFHITFSGECRNLTEQEYAIAFWKNMVYSRIFRNGYFVYHPSSGHRISDYVKRGEMINELSKLTIRQIRKWFKNMAEVGCVERGRYFPFNNMLDLLLKNGFEEDEDVATVMFHLIYYSKLCTYGEYSWENLFHKSFYFTLYRLAKKDNFKELLINHPEELFKKDIYWTEELIAKEEEEWFSFKLACFDIVNKQLEIQEEKDEDGVIENIIVRPKNPNCYRGTVSYDIKNDEYVIGWVDDFDLDLIHEVENQLKLDKKCKYDFDNLQDTNEGTAVSDDEIIF